MEKKYLGMEKNIAFGLAYLIPIIAIILFCVEKDNMDHDEKAMAMSSILNIIASSVTCGIFGIIALVCSIKSFMGDYTFKLPLLYNISESIVGKE